VSRPPISLPRLYPIVDASLFRGTAAMLDFACELAAAGATLLQYRNKKGSPRQMLSDARELRRVLGRAVTLIMNDRPDLCVMAGCDGVHVGQEDLSPASARAILQAEEAEPTAGAAARKPLWLGVSTHNPEQLRVADQQDTDYLAIGPVFTTGSKENPDPVVGLEGVRGARELTRKPLVAIGGITPENCRSVLEAGADSVAVISVLLENPRKSVAAFFRVLG